MSRAPKPAKAPEPVSVPLAAIIADERAQSRAARDDGAVAEYAEAMAAGVVFPPLVVFKEGDRFWLAEGFHRLAAGLQADLAELPCDVRAGGLRDAILHSAGANADHGLRRTNADKRRAVLMLLQDDEWGGWTTSKVAIACRVSRPLVDVIRGELTCSSASDDRPAPPPSASPATIAKAQEIEEAGGRPRFYNDRHGNVSVMDTGRIGRPQPDPEPPAQAKAPAPASPADDAGNVVVLGNRLTIMPSPGAVERDHLADEAADDLRGAEDYDASRLDHRARAINGALNTFDFVRITGREYWQVYGKSPSRETFIAWVRAAKTTIDDIVKEHDRVGKA